MVAGGDVLGGAEVTHVRAKVSRHLSGLTFPRHGNRRLFGGLPLGWWRKLLHGR
jgi:hypothetical protein